MSKRCCERVHDTGRLAVGFHDCSRPVRVSVDGKDYCAIHDPAKVNERRVKSDAAWKAECKKRSIELSGHEMLQTLKDIRLSNAGSKERKRGWDNALEIIERLEGKR